MSHVFLRYFKDLTHGQKHLIEALLLSQEFLNPNDQEISVKIDEVNLRMCAGTS